MEGSGQGAVLAAAPGCVAAEAGAASVTNVYGQTERRSVVGGRGLPRNWRRYGHCPAGVWRPRSGGARRWATEVRSACSTTTRCRRGYAASGWRPGWALPPARFALVPDKPTGRQSARTTFSPPRTTGDQLLGSVQEPFGTMARVLAAFLRQPPFSRPCLHRQLLPWPSVPGL